MNTIRDVRRSTAEAKLGGVCAAAATRWQIDPTVVRIGAVLLALSSGIGLVLYAAAWVLLPREGSDTAPIDGVLPQARRWPTVAWIVLLVLACIFTASVLGPATPFGVLPAGVLAAMWYFGYYRPRVAESKYRSSHQLGLQVPIQPYAGPATPFTEAAMAWQQRVQAYQREQAAAYRRQQVAGHSPDHRTPERERHVFAEQASPEPVGQRHQAWPVQEPLREFEAGVRPQASALQRSNQTPQNPVLQPMVSDPGYSLNAFLAMPDPVGLYEPVPQGSTQAPIHRRSRRRLGFVTVALIGLAMAAVGVADMSLSVPFYAYPAAGLLAMGLILIAGTWLGRPRGLAAFAIALSLVVLPMTMDRVSGGPQQPHLMSYTQVQEIPPVSAYDVGNHRVDLSRVKVTEPTRREFDVDSGNLEVIVPKDTNLRIEWSVQAGRADILDYREHTTGVDLANTTIARAADPNAPELTLVLKVDVGNLEVRQ